MPPGAGPRARAPVFYNPAMALDRDLAVALVRAWAQARAPLRSGWEMMAATGARGLRLLVEGGSFETFTLTEANPIAEAVLRDNARSDVRARVVHADARTVPPGSPFDYVDLDPYGTPAPFADTAIDAVRPGGLVAVTATDMTVLAGAQPAACRARYGATPVRGRLGPEGGLRILLAFLAGRARARGRTLRPVFCYVLGHHVRAVVEINAGPGDPEPVASIDPASWAGAPLGPGGPYGPLWVGPLFAPEVVTRLEPPEGAADPAGAASFLARVADETGIDVPFYFEPNALAKSLALERPPRRATVIEALRASGFRAGRTHVRPEGVRTDAPRSTVESVVRGLAKGGQSQNARVRA